MPAFRMHSMPVSGLAVHNLRNITKDLIIMPANKKLENAIGLYLEGIRDGLFYPVSLALIVVFFFSQFNTGALAQTPDYDIVVIGGTPAGIAAAIAAGRAGKRVMIVEQSPVLGGMLASGVLRLDDHIRQANSGIMEEFRQGRPGNPERRQGSLRKWLQKYRRSQLALTKLRLTFN